MRLLVVCDVALGKCMDLHKKDFSLTEAPPGYDSVHGVPKTATVSTDFEVFIARNISSNKKQRPETKTTLSSKAFNQFGRPNKEFPRKKKPQRIHLL